MKPLYRIRISKYFNTYCSDHIGETIVDYSYVKTVYYIEQKRKYWWGWSTIYMSHDQDEIDKVLKNLHIMDNWKDQIINLGESN